MQFESTEKMINYLRDCRNETYGQDFSVKNYIKDGVVTVYEPSFAPPDGFRFSYVVIGYYCTYTYYTDAWTTSREHKMSSMFESARAAAQSRPFPGSSWESLVEVPSEEMITGSGKPKTSSEQNELLSQQKAEEKYTAQNRILLQWCTQKSEDPLADPLARMIEEYSLKPLGNSKNPKYYYKEQNRYGELWAYDVYWNTDGYLCYAYIPSVFFTEKTVAEICSFTLVMTPCYN